MKKIFFKNHTQNVVEKLFPALLQNVKIDHISGSIIDSFTQFVFIVCQVEGYRNMLKLSDRPIAFTSYKEFLKNKKRSGTGFPASFST